MPDPALEGLYGLKTYAFGWTELIAALALGVLLAILIGVIVHVFRRRSVPDMNRLAAVSDLPDDARAVVLAGLLREETERLAPGDRPWTDRAAERFRLDDATVRQLSDLYRPGARLDPEPLYQALKSLERT